VASSPTFVNIKFSAAFPSYAGSSTTYQISYSICHWLGCNYRNVTTQYVYGDTIGKQDVVYVVVFYSASGTADSAFPAALVTALPSTSVTTAGSLAYGFQTAGIGAIPSFAGIYPLSAYSGPAAPPIPPPPPPSPSPPSPYVCTCTNGYTGANCSVAPP
jgi:hypothetical protein